MTRIQYRALEPSNIPSSICGRRIRATTKNRTANPNWILAGTRGDGGRAAARGARAGWSSSPGARHQQHRPRERRTNLPPLAVPAEQLDKRRPAPVVEVTGRVAKVTQVGPAGDVQRSPQRL